MEYINNLDVVKKQKMTVRGNQIPQGLIKISGAKNAATKLMAASLLTNEHIKLFNFPTKLVDVKYKAMYLQKIGAYVEIDQNNDIIDIRTDSITSDLLEHYNYPIRTTYLLVAGQLIRYGIARIPYPGGCRIGERKYDLHILVWKKMGCSVEERDDYIEIKGKLKPAEISFPISTIGGTENALICASGIDGETIIRNAYISPETYCLINFLRELGANIDTTGNSYIKVRGSTRLRGTSFRVIPDRIEALTWIIFAALSRGTLVISDVPFEYMDVPLIHLKECGIDVFRNSTSIYISPKCFINKNLQPFELACGTYPGVISDMQPFFTLLGLKAHGISRIYDYRYPERTKYLVELSQFCPNALEWNYGMIKLTGPVEFQAAEVTSTDLRGSMALVLAGLLADGETIIHNVDMALRGYNNLVYKLNQLGIHVDINE